MQILKLIARFTAHRPLITMKHPFQNIVATDTHVFTTVKNHLQVFELTTIKIVGEWVDHVKLQDTLKKQQLERISESEKLSETAGSEVDTDTPSEEPETKRAKTTKVPKIPVPGPGAPPIYNYIRGLKLTQDAKYLIGITDSDKSIIIFTVDFSAPNCLKLIKRQVFPKRPCSISIDSDQNAVIGDKFGDVYKIPIDSQPPVSEKQLVPILGHVSMLTQVLMIPFEGKQYILTADRDEHIKVSYYPQTFVVKHWLFGHEEFISSMVVPGFDAKLLITAGGDNSIYLWNWLDNKLVSSFDFSELVQPFLNETHLPPERFITEDSGKESTVVKLVQYQRKVVILFENVKCLVSVNINPDLSLSFDTLLTLEAPLIDLALAGDKLIGCSDDADLLQCFGLPELKVESPLREIGQANPCEVASRDEFYPLYTMNSLRKRSEH